MDPHGPTAQRFPLVARFRPACLPLPERVQALRDLASRAADAGDQGLASAVFNQAALIASDLGLPELAGRFCHQHAAAYLHACPLPGMSAIRALEPVVNLARLQMRAGHGDDARRRLLTLYDAVDTGTAVQFDQIAVPPDLTADAEDRREVVAWLWRVLLADGTRTLTTAGRWSEALAHIERHRGIGRHMLDGRQVAVLAALTAGAVPAAEALVHETEPGEPWEQAVTDHLAILCRLAAGKPADPQIQDLTDTYVGRPLEHGATVFHIRLGLALLDAITSAGAPAARKVVAELFRTTVETADGYAARETLAHPLFLALADRSELRECRALLHASALDAGELPGDLHGHLTEALRTSDHTIRQSVARPE